jgi:hypothetical protein
MELYKIKIEKKRTERAQIKKSNFQKIKINEKRLIASAKI